MNKMIKTALSAVLALTLAGCATGKDTSLEDVKKAGKLRIGLEGDWQPFSYHDENDKLVGFDTEVAQNVAERLGVEAEITEAAWDGLLTGLSTGVYDVVVNGVDVTDDRKSTFEFSEPYAYDHIDLIVRKDNTTIKTFEDLKGRTSANSIGSTYAKIAEDYGATISNVPTLSETMALVLNGTVEASINADTAIQDYIKTTNETNLVVVAQAEDITSYAIPVKKGSVALQEAISDAIKEMREDGTLKELSEKYFGIDITNK